MRQEIKASVTGEKIIEMPYQVDLRGNGRVANVNGRVANGNGRVAKENRVSYVITIDLLKTMRQ